MFATLFLSLHRILLVLPVGVRSSNVMKSFIFIAQRNSRFQLYCFTLGFAGGFTNKTKLVVHFSKLQSVHTRLFIFQRKNKPYLNGVLCFSNNSTSRIWFALLQFYRNVRSITRTDVCEYCQKGKLFRAHHFDLNWCTIHSAF